MKYLKLFEEFDGFVELSYVYYQDYIMVDIFKGHITDIYTNNNHNIQGFKWEVGRNSAFVHLNKKDWSDMLEELLDSESSHLINVTDDEGDWDEEYNKLQKEMEELIRTQIPILSATGKYNI